MKHPDLAEADRFFNWPYAAVEEALSNAVYHKAYDEREPIEVRVDKDMMEIISHPGPDRSVTREGLRAFNVHSRRYRNRRIGEFLKELHLTEGRNTGFRKILNALGQNGSPLPEFETDEAHDYFITRLFVKEGFYDYEGVETRPENVGVDDENVGVSPENVGVDDENVGVDANSIYELLPVAASQTLSRYSRKREDTFLRLLALLHEDGRATTPHIALTLGLTERTIQRYLRELQQHGIIKHVGGDRFGTWMVNTRDD